MDDWIEAQKQRLLQNSEANGEFGCLLCQLGGGQTAYSTLTVTFPWNKSWLCIKINTDHLSYEPASVNNDRQICRGIFPTRCKSHAPYKDFATNSPLASEFCKSLCFWASIQSSIFILS
jgi:hypothetical protein